MAHIKDQKTSHNYKQTEFLIIWDLILDLKWGNLQ